MKPTFWKAAAIAMFVIVVAESALLFKTSPLFNSSREAEMTPKDDGFEAFEGIAFAREFSERFQTFDSRNFKATQVAAAFLLDDETRAKRLAEIERLSEKIERREVVQRARLKTLMRLPVRSQSRDDRFRADVLVDLSEGAGAVPARTQFTTRLEFTLVRTERTAQNTWGFLVSDLTQEVLKDTGIDRETVPEFSLRPSVAMLVRFPCSVENVELPKGTSVRVKLTTLDISELQMTTAVPLAGEQTVKAVCRDRAFTMKVRGEDASSAMTNPLVVLKSLSMDNSVALVKPADRESRREKRKKAKTGLSRSIEEQLGFVIEEE